MKLEERSELRLDHSATTLWEHAQQLIEKRVGTPAFEVWIRPLQLQSINDSLIVLAANNDHGRQTVISRYQKDILESLSQAMGRQASLQIIVDASLQSADNYTPSIASITIAQAPGRDVRDGITVGGSASQADQLRLQTTSLNPKYTLQSFVVGSHNRFCHSAAVAVADRPGETYNPLFIYSGVGLGKTHIMQAIGHQVLLKNPRLTVRYLTGEKFTNDLINSIQNSSSIEFRKRYRQVDVLLVDDIQFIEGKESTQEEFFHTFNSLRETGRQIVLSSDRPPKDFRKLEDRLRSRFGGGLIADMQPPDLETRLAILHKKCEIERLSIPDVVLEYIASLFTSNIRELEGALLRAHAYASLTGTSLDISTAASVFQIGAPVTNRPTMTVETIIGAVSTHYRVDTSDLRSPKRSKDLALPRHVAMFLANDLLSMSHSRIGEYFGNRAHSSVIYAIAKVKQGLRQDANLSHAVVQIRRQLGV